MNYDDLEIFDDFLHSHENYSGNILAYIDQHVLYIRAVCISYQFSVRISNKYFHTLISG